MAALTFSEYAERDAVGLAELVKSQQVTPKELWDVAVAGIEKLNPKVNAVIDRWFNRGLRAIESGLPQGFFHGVPFLIKDMLDVKGTHMTMASVMLADYICQHTHELIKRLESSGLVILGRTNMSELGLVPITEPVMYGPTHNPWDFTRSPGGSSGGSAAAVAAGMVPMAYAADGGGSIRIPSAACGVFGLKPSRGRNPQECDDDPDGFVVHHVISRSVRDSAAILDVTQGARPTDRWQLNSPSRTFLEMIREDPKPLRLGFCVKDFMNHPAAFGCADAIRKTARLCEQLGHQVEEISWSIDGEAFFRGFKVLWAYGVGFFFRRVQEELQRDERIPKAAKKLFQMRRAFDLFTTTWDLRLAKPRLEPFTRRMADIESNYYLGDLWLAWTQMQKVIYEFTKYYERYDVLLTPTLGEPTWKIGQWNVHVSDEELQDILMRYVGYTPIANVGGFPAMSVPLYRMPNGLPTGSHFIAPVNQDGLLLQLAAQLERAEPWWSQKPPVFIC